MNSFGANRALNLVLPLLLLIIVFSSHVLGSEKDYYEFTYPWNQPLKFPFELPLTSDATAGDRGYLKALGENVVFEKGNGKPERLWGMEVYVSKDFPPKNREHSQALVRKISSFGFNLVRISGIDTPRYELFDHWSKKGDLDSPEMDRLDFFISELRKAGIYYVLTINDSPLKARNVRGVEKNGHKIEQKQHKHVQLYDESVVAKTLGWHRDFYQHTNPYTRLEYGRDPANIYIAAVGEDSIFDGYFWEESKYLSDANIRYLQKQFNQYLFETYGTNSALKAAWGGLDWGESLDKRNIKFHLAGKLDRLEKSRSRDLMKFLYQIDYDYAKQIKDVLDDIGYQGLFTVTNGWYGLGNRLVNEELGDFVDIHGYFDHPIRARRKGRYSEYIGNTEHLAGSTEQRKRRRIFKRNFYKFFTSAPRNKPLMISEWNQAAFSDYAYEGPLLITAYSALQGYSSLTVHTFFAFDRQYTDEYGDRNLAGGTNPILMSLSPSLAIAYRNGYINEANATREVVIASNMNEFWEKARQTKMNWSQGIYKPYVNDAFENKVRTTLIGKKPKSLPEKEESRQWRSDTGQILWDFSDSENAFLQVDSSMFFAAAGKKETPWKTSAITVGLDEPSAVTVVSLDNRNLEDSTSMLVTAVSSFKNSGQKKEYGLKYRGRRNLVRIDDPGTAPLYMKRVRGYLTLKSQHGRKPNVQGIAIDGSLIQLPGIQYTKSAQGLSTRIPLGNIDTPYYWIHYQNDKKPL